MTKISDTVFKFDVNRRVYRRTENGSSSGGPIYREHFMPYVIVGEDRRSWILDVPDRKYGGGPFPGKTSKAKVLTAADVDAMCWRNDHSYRLRDMVGNCQDTAILKQIAALIGYDETEIDRQKA